MVLMATDKVQRTQELRRSSAASPIPGKRVCDEAWTYDEEED